MPMRPHKHDLIAASNGWPPFSKKRYESVRCRKCGADAPRRSAALRKLIEGACPR